MNLYPPKTADAKYDSITFTTRHRYWMNAPILLYRTSPRNHYCSTLTPSILSLARSFTTCSSQSSPKPTSSILRPHFPIHHFVRPAYAVSLPLPKRLVYAIRRCVTDHRLALNWLSLICIRGRTIPADTQKHIASLKFISSPFIFAYQNGSPPRPLTVASSMSLPVTQLDHPERTDKCPQTEPVTNIGSAWSSLLTTLGDHLCLGILPPSQYMSVDRQYVVGVLEQ